MLNRIKQATSSKKGESYIYVCVLVLFISALVSVVIMYMGLMSELTELQQRRIHLYYIEKKTLKEIADMEGSALQSVHESIVSAINNLKAKKYF